MNLCLWSVERQRWFNLPPLPRSPHPSSSDEQCDIDEAEWEMLEHEECDAERVMEKEQADADSQSQQLPPDAENFNAPSTFASDVVTDENAEMNGAGQQQQYEQQEQLMTNGELESVVEEQNEQLSPQSTNEQQFGGEFQQQQQQQQPQEELQEQQNAHPNQQTADSTAQPSKRKRIHPALLGHIPEHEQHQVFDYDDRLPAFRVVLFSSVALPSSHPLMKLMDGQLDADVQTINDALRNDSTQTNAATSSSLPFPTSISDLQSQQQEQQLSEQKYPQHGEGQSNSERTWQAHDSPFARSPRPEQEQQQQQQQLQQAIESKRAQFEGSVSAQQGTNTEDQQFHSHELLNTSQLSTTGSTTTAETTNDTANQSIAETSMLNSPSRSLNEQLSIAQNAARAVDLPFILHIHGGGERNFCSSSGIFCSSLCSFRSYRFLLYVRMLVGFLADMETIDRASLSGWAQEVKVPILSIHYSLAPEHKFPGQSVSCLPSFSNLFLKFSSRFLTLSLCFSTVPLEQCFLLYRMAVRCVQLAGFHPRIALVGDSAGGQLCLSLSLRIQAHNEGLDVSPFLRVSRDQQGNIIQTAVPCCAHTAAERAMLLEEINNQSSSLQDESMMVEGKQRQSAADGQQQHQHELDQEGNEENARQWQSDSPANANNANESKHDSSLVSIASSAKSNRSALTSSNNNTTPLREQTNSEEDIDRHVNSARRSGSSRRAVQDNEETWQEQQEPQEQDSNNGMHEHDQQLSQSPSSTGRSSSSWIDVQHRANGDSPQFEPARRDSGASGEMREDRDRDAADRLAFSSSSLADSKRSYNEPQQPVDFSLLDLSRSSHQNYHQLNHLQVSSDLGADGSQPLPLVSPASAMRHQYHSLSLSPPQVQIPMPSTLVLGNLSHFFLLLCLVLFAHVRIIMCSFHVTICFCFFSCTAYPASNSCPTVSPSRLVQMGDVVLRFSALMGMMQLNFAGHCPFCNMFLSPVLAPAQLLSALPPTHVLAGLIAYCWYCKLFFICLFFDSQSFILSCCS